MALRLGELLSDHGDFAEAAHELHDAFVAALAGHDEDAAARSATDLIQALGEQQGRYEEADGWARVAEALAGRLARKDELLGALYTKRTMLRERQGRYLDALADARRALAVEARTLGPEHSEVAETWFVLARIYYRLAKYPESLEAYQRTLDLQQRTLGADNPALIKTIIGFADVYGDSGDHERAVAEYRRALAATLRVRPDHPNLAMIWNNLGGELIALGRPREAFDEFQRALVAWQSQVGVLSYETATARNNLGQAKLDLGELDEALRQFKQGLEVCEQVLGSSHRLCGVIRGGIGETYRRLGRPEQALAHLTRAVAIIEKALGTAHPELVPPLLSIGRVELGRHAAGRAKAPLERALAIRTAQPDDGIELADVRFALAQATWSLGDVARARTLAAQARDAYVRIGPARRAALAEVAAWLGRHSEKIADTR